MAGSQPSLQGMPIMQFTRHLALRIHILLAANSITRKEGFGSVLGMLHIGIAIFSTAIQYNTTNHVLQYNRTLQICCIF